MVLWPGEGMIPDPPVEGLFICLREVKLMLEVHLFSTRSKAAGGATLLLTLLQDDLSFAF